MFILVLMNIFLLVMKSLYNKVNGLGYAVIGNIFLIIGFILKCILGFKETEYLGVLISASDLLGMNFLVIAIFVFFDKRIDFKKYLTINFLNILFAIYFIYISNSLSLRRSFVSFFIFLIFIDGAIFLKNKYCENNLYSYKIIKYIFYIFSGYYFVRIFLSYTSQTSSIIIFDSNLFLSITLILFIFFSILITFAFAFMTIDTLFNDVKKMSIIDSLTGLHNRRYLYLNLENLMNELKREDSYFLLVFIDIDDFKKINDLYGHNTGDKILRLFSNLLKSNLREVDIIARYGGDEFIAVLKNTFVEDGYFIFERILNTTRINNWEQEECKITFSASIKKITQEDAYKDIDDLINEVDTKMYSAKKEGRDRILIV